MNGDLAEGEHVTYLKDKASLSQENERHVIVMLDEI